MLKGADKVTKDSKLFMFPTKDPTYSEDAAYFNIKRRSYVEDPRFTSSFHWHDYFEMEFFCEGDGVHILNGKELEVRKGTIYLVTPADFHTLYPHQGKAESMRYYNINFNEYALSPDMLKLVGEYSAPMSTVVTGEDYDVLCREFKALNEEFHSSRPLKDEMVKILFEKIFLLFWRELIKGGGEPQRAWPRKDSSVRYIVSYLRIHFREQVSLTALAKEVHLTPNYIGELFRKETGMSFTDYVQKLRLGYATNLLVSSDMSVADISAQSGFHSVSYFIRSFRLANEKNPLEYRRSASKNK